MTNMGHGRTPSRSCLLIELPEPTITPNPLASKGSPFPNRAVKKSLGEGNRDWLRLYPAGACPDFPAESGTGTSAALWSQSPIPPRSWTFE